MIGTIILVIVLTIAILLSVAFGYFLGATRNRND